MKNLTKFILQLIFLGILILPFSCTLEDDSIGGGDDDNPSTGSTGAEELISPITQDLTLTDINPNEGEADYYVESSLSLDAVLTIEPGVIIEFPSNARFMIEKETAAIIAKGTATNRIIFKGAIESSGSWRGIKVESNDVRNHFDYCIIEHAGSSEHPALSINGDNFLSTGKAKLTNSIIRNNLWTGMLVSSDGDLAEFSNNTFENNGGSSVKTDCDNASKLDSNTKYAGNNGFDGVRIYESKLELPGESVWPDLGVDASYLVEANLEIKQGLKIEAGARFQFEPGNGMSIGGFDGENAYLIAIGTSDKKIIFSGLDELSEPSWGGIAIQENDVRNELNHCEVSYGGGVEFEDGRRANIYLDTDWNNEARLKIANTVIRNSGGCGVYIDDGQDGGVLIDNGGNSFTNNPLGNTCN